MRQDWWINDGVEGCTLVQPLAKPPVVLKGIQPVGPDVAPMGMGKPRSEGLSPWKPHPWLNQADPENTTEHRTLKPETGAGFTTTHSP